jgi:hypothetical protein
MNVITFALLAACASIQTRTKVLQTFPDGSSVILTTVYHFGPDGHDHDSFLDSAGHPYAGTDSFILRLTEDLRRIEAGGANGRDLIGWLEQDPRITEVARGGHNDADMDLGTYVHWDPDGTAGAPDDSGGSDRPAYIGLAHELSHIEDVWRGTVNRKIWKVLPGEGGLIEVPYAELYATHIENLIRAENHLALRVSYASALLGPGGVRYFADRASLLLRPGTRQSLYFDCQGHTTYHTLGKREVAETY